MEVGIFGGSFDPPHLGHMIVAMDALEKLGLDSVRFVPANVSPFKTGEEDTTDPRLRLRMVEAAVDGHPAFRVDRSEIEREGPSWTIDTIDALRAAEPDVRWSLLVGADQWSAFDRWREAERLASVARVVVLAREGLDPQAGPELPHLDLPVTRIDISSSGIRARVREGRSIRYLVPEPVRALIEANGLYATC